MKSLLHLELLLQGFFVGGVVDVAVWVLRRVVHITAPALERQILAEPDRQVGLEGTGAEESVAAVWESTITTYVGKEAAPERNQLTGLFGALYSSLPRVATGRDERAREPYLADEVVALQIEVSSSWKAGQPLVDGERQTHLSFFDVLVVSAGQAGLHEVDVCEIGMLLRKAGHEVGERRDLVCYGDVCRPIV